MIELNKIYCEDNIDVLKEIPDNFVDVIYIDPPFSTGRIFKTTNDELAYEDKYTLQELLDILESRIIEIHRVLKESGTFYIHGDYRFIPYVRVMCDKIFGINNFRREIIWNYGLGNARGKSDLLEKHDTILKYSKTNNYNFNLIRGDVTPQMKAKYCHEDEDGKYMMSYGKKYYLKGGKPLEDVWNDVPTISATSSERTGYPTQKPTALLDRILKLSLPYDKETNTYSGIVADFFAGSGTTLKVAKDLGVNYIGCDSSELAVEYINNRLKNVDISIK